MASVRACACCTIAYPHLFGRTPRASSALPPGTLTAYRTPQRREPTLADAAAARVLRCSACAPVQRRARQLVRRASAVRTPLCGLAGWVRLRGACRLACAPSVAAVLCRLDGQHADAGGLRGPVQRVWHVLHMAPLGPPLRHRLPVRPAPHLGRALLPGAPPAPASPALRVPTCMRWCAHAPVPERAAASSSCCTGTGVRGRHVCRASRR